MYEKMKEKMKSAIENLYESVKSRIFHKIDRIDFSYLRKPTKEKTVKAVIQLIDEDGNPVGQPIETEVHDSGRRTVPSEYYERKSIYRRYPITIDVQDDKIVVDGLFERLSRSNEEKK